MFKTINLTAAASALALSASAVSAQTATVPSTADPVTTMPSTTSTDSTVETPTTGSIDTSVTIEATAAVETTAAPVAAPAEGTIAAAVGANADLSTLGTALTATELTGTLGGTGPFTVFAPTNAAFDLIPAATRTQLMDPANKESLATILKFHVVPGNITAAQLREQIAAGGGTASLQTVAGQTLRASLEGEQIVLSGENNSKAYIASADNAQTNGTVHVVNGILVPRLG